MAFDRTSDADKLALKTEVNSDPLGMGYAAVMGQTTQLLKLLNDPENTTGGSEISREFDLAAMLDALVPSELDAAQTTVGAAEYVNVLANAWNVLGDISAYKAKFRALFGVNSATVLALDAQVMRISRAEVLFGEGTTISRDDWFAARDS